ncbi:hypothetical protein Tco_0902991 [Tanacetum coccineum]
MSEMANTTPIMTTVTKAANKEKTPKEADAALKVNILDFCEEHYEDILPVIMDKIRRGKRKEVHARLDFGESFKKSRRVREGSQNSSAGTLPARQSAFDRLSDTYSPSTTKSGPDMANSRDHAHSRGRPRRRDSSPSGDRPRSKDRLRGIKESYGNTCSSNKTGAKHRYHSRDRDRSRSVKRGRESESPLSRMSESGTSNGGHWKSKSKRRKPTGEEDLAVSWSCEEVDPFTPRISNFKSSQKTRMPKNVKTYDGAQVERWAMPTWCHMFNSTLIGTARVWFDELSPESIDGYKDLKAAFLAYFMQQKKYVKDPVEIHNIKARGWRDLSGVNKPELNKERLNEHVLKTMEEMMTATTAFIREETVVASKKKGHTSTPKEILVAEAGKFKPPPPMVTPVEKRSNNKFCDFHNDKGHKTDECVQLKKQIEELVRAGKLSHLIKEIKQGRDQPKVEKKEVPVKDKSATIYIVQLWHRMTRQKVTQSFARVREITFPPLATSRGTKGPLVIEAEIGGHMIHRIHYLGGEAFNIMMKETIGEGPTLLAWATVTTTSKEILKEAEVRHENFKVALHSNFPDQEVAIGGTLRERTNITVLAP